MRLWVLAAGLPCLAVFIRAVGGRSGDRARAGSRSGIWRGAQVAENMNNDPGVHDAILGFEVERRLVGNECRE